MVTISGGPVVASIIVGLSIIGFGVVGAAGVNWLDRVVWRRMARRTGKDPDSPPPWW